MNNSFQHMSFIKPLVPASAGVSCVYWNNNGNCGEYNRLVNLDR